MHMNDLSDSTVYVVDDDQAMQDMLRWLFRSAGYRVETYGSIKAFVEGYESDSPGCLVLDLHMPGMTGMEFLSRKGEFEIELPIIILTGNGSVSHAVQAFKSGALDFVEKPFDEENLLQVVWRAMDGDVTRRRDKSRQSTLKEMFNNLTDREMEVLSAVAAGLSNREASVMIGVSQKTVEFHRANIMKKSGMKSLADLIRAYMEFQVMIEDGSSRSAG